MIKVLFIVLSLLVFSSSVLALSIGQNGNLIGVLLQQQSSSFNGSNMSFDYLTVFHDLTVFGNIYNVSTLNINVTGNIIATGNVSANCLTLANGQPICWNVDYYTLNVPTGLGNVIQVGQELTLIKKNKAGKTIYNGQIVYDSGSQGEMITVDLADANISFNKIHDLGMVTIDSCADNSACPITYFGAVHDLNTLSYTEGDSVYLKCDGSGNFTNVEPTGSCYRMHLGKISRIASASGVIEFNPEIDYADNPLFYNLHVVNNLTASYLFGLLNASYVQNEYWVNVSGDTMMGQLNVNNNVNISSGNLYVTNKIYAGNTIYANGNISSNNAPIVLGQGLVNGNTVTNGSNAGALEYSNNSLFFTNWKVRRTVVQAQQVVLDNISVSNTVSETTLINVPHGADYLRVGKMEEIVLHGVMNSQLAAGSNTLTITIYYAGIQIGNFTIAEANRNNVDVTIEFEGTVRSMGASGTMQIHSHVEMIDTVTTANPHINGLASIDTTTPQNLTITAKWSDASTSNSFTILQGRALSIDDN